MTAVARFHFDAVLIRVATRVTAIFLDLHFSGDRTVAQIVRAFDALLHVRRLPALG
jgi:hypothetical protein